MICFEMRVDRLLKIVQYCDLISGSEQKHFKEIQMFYDNGIQAYVTDGGLYTHFQIPVSTQPFDHTFLLPIPGIKLFLQNQTKETPVRVTLREREMVLEIGEELLAILQPNPPYRKPMKAYRILGHFPFKEFLRGLDFASVRMAENERVSFFVREGLLTVSTVYDDLTAIYQSFCPCQNLNVVLPYYNLRHLIKAYNLLDVSELRLGISEDQKELAFQISGALSVIACDPMDRKEMVQALQLGSMNESLNPLFETETTRFRKALAKALKLSHGSKIEMVLDKESVELHIRQDRIYYSVREPGRWVAEDEGYPWKVRLAPDAILSMISRITSRQISISYDHGFLSISDPQHKRALMMKSEVQPPFERSDSHESLARSNQ